MGVRIVLQKLLIGKGSQLDVVDAAGQGLGAFPNKLLRGRPKEQEFPGTPLFIYHHPDQREKLRPHLYFIDTDQLFPLAVKEELRIIELAQIGRTLQV